jgi:hypothetical protein
LFENNFLTLVLHIINEMTHSERHGRSIGPLRARLAARGKGGASPVQQIPHRENDVPSYPSPAEEGKAPLPPWLFGNSGICMPRIIRLIIKL